MGYKSPLSVLFAESPFKPLQTHIETVHECTQQLTPFLDAVINEDWDEVIVWHKKIRDLEHSADEMKREIRLNLPKGIFLPVDRRDLLDLLSRQDRIANLAKDIAGVIFGRKLTFPKSMKQELKSYVSRNIDACAQAVKAVNELDELITSGFRGQESALVEKLIDELDQIENDSDNQQKELRTQLLALESDLNCIDVMFMYKVIDFIGGLADNAQLVGDRLELMVTR